MELVNGSCLICGCPIPLNNFPKLSFIAQQLTLARVLKELSSSEFFFSLLISHLGRLKLKSRLSQINSFNLLVILLLSQSLLTEQLLSLFKLLLTGISTNNTGVNQTVSYSLFPIILFGATINNFSSTRDTKDFILSRNKLKSKIGIIRIAFNHIKQIFTKKSSSLSLTLNTPLLISISHQELPPSEIRYGGISFAFFSSFEEPSSHIKNIGDSVEGDGLFHDALSGRFGCYNVRGFGNFRTKLCHI